MGDTLRDLVNIALCFLLGIVLYWMATPAALSPQQVCAQHPGWTAAECQDVATHLIWIGMTPEMALASWGRPADVNTYASKYGTREQWVYRGANDAVYLYFDDGVLTSWQD